MKKTYKIEIDCANCAAKVQEAIKKIDGVVDCNINFMTQSMILEADESKIDELAKKALKVGKRIEPDFCIVK